jgi:hypothetical protein
MAVVVVDRGILARVSAPDGGAAAGTVRTRC